MPELRVETSPYPSRSLQDRIKVLRARLGLEDLPCTNGPSHQDISENVRGIDEDFAARGFGNMGRVLWVEICSDRFAGLGLAPIGEAGGVTTSRTTPRSSC